jgi:hypothetical protein
MAQRTFLVTSGALLELDSQICGGLRRFEGGDAVGNVVPEQAASNSFVRKHLGGVKYEDLVLAFGADMSSSVYTWIVAMLGRSDRPKNGAVVLPNADLKTASRLEFSNALISEVSFPALDASSKDPVSMRIRVTPEVTRSSSGSSSSIAGKSLSRVWLGSNFRLQIDGLDCTGVNSIDAMTVTRPVLDAGKVSGDELPKVGSIDVANLVFTIAESRAAALIAWHEEFVIKGKVGAEKNGTLQFLEPNLKDVLFTLSFHNLGIFKLARVDAGTGAGAVRRLRAEMYCEELSFQYMASVVQDGSGDGSQPGTSNGGSGGGGQDGAGGEIQDGTAAGDSGAGGQTSPTGRFTRLPMSRPQTLPNVPDRARLNFRT